MDMTYREPDFLPWDGQTVPLTLLGGYLGAGKTTVINELLGRSELPIAVLVNDLGSVNIDATLIKQRNSDTIEFTDGCVCCSLSSGLGPAFDQLRQRPTPPAHVILELSGVADPDRVRPWGKSAGFRLDGVVVLVDCDQFGELLQLPAPAAMLTRQVQAADLIVLTKTDLATAERTSDTKSRVRALAPNTPVIDSPSALGTAGILELGGRSNADRPEVPPISLFDLHVADLMPIPDPISEEELQALLDSLDESVIRAKGIARTPDGRRLLVQVVGRRRVLEPMSAGHDVAPTDLVRIRLR